MIWEKVCLQYRVIYVPKIRLGRALQKSPITQEELAKKLQFMSMEDMSTLIISRIEKNQRHVCDGELRMLAKALNVTWNGWSETVMILN